MASPLAPIPSDLQQKDAALQRCLQHAGPVLVAFSGGVDSSYLAFAAHRVLGSGVLAVTALSPSYPRSHREVALAVVERFGIPHRFVETDEMAQESYRANGPDRCYHCKTELFTVLGQLRDTLGYAAVAYGVNMDDTGDFRPGHRAAEEQGVLSPYLEVGLGKQEIRALSRAAHVPSAELPASACLASRLPYGTKVTAERLAQVEEGEERLHALGFQQLRLRHHGTLARVELAPKELPRALDPAMAQRIVAAIKPLGFRFVSLDLEGYRSGALNEELTQGERDAQPPLLPITRLGPERA